MDVQKHLELRTRHKVWTRQRLQRERLRPAPGSAPHGWGLRRQLPLQPMRGRGGGRALCRRGD